MKDFFISISSWLWGEHIGTKHISHLEQIDIQLSMERIHFVEEIWEEIINNLRNKEFE